MKTPNSVTIGGAVLAEKIDRWNDLSSSCASQYEVPEGDATLVLVDMQPNFLHGWDAAAQPMIEAVIRQVNCAIRNNWSIVLLELKPWRLGETIDPIVELLDGKKGKYAKFARRSKQQSSGAKELIACCEDNGFPMQLFRITGVFLDACVLNTASDLLELEPTCLVRMMHEACSTDIDAPGAWSYVEQQLGSNLRFVISSEGIDNIDKIDN